MHPLDEKGRIGNAGQESSESIIAQIKIFERLFFLDEAEDEMQPSDRDEIRKSVGGSYQKEGRLTGIILADPKRIRKPPPADADTKQEKTDRDLIFLFQQD